MQQPLDQQTGGRFGVQSTLGQDLFPRRLEVLPEGRHRRHGNAFGALAQEDCHLLFEHAPRRQRSRLAPGLALARNALQVVEVIDEGAIQVLDRRLDVARHGNIQEQDRSPPPLLERRIDQRNGQWQCRPDPRAVTTISAAAMRLGKLLPRPEMAAQAVCRSLGAALRAVQDDEIDNASLPQLQGHELAHFAKSDDQERCCGPVRHAGCERPAGPRP